MSKIIHPAMKYLKEDKDKNIHPAKKYLREEIDKIEFMIENKKAELEKWDAIAKGTTMQLSEKVQTSSRGDKLTNAVIKISQIQEEINECIIELKNKEKEIIGVIEQLDAKEYDLIHKVYLQRLSLKQYQYMKHISYSSVITTHGRALNNVLKILERKKDEQGRI